MKIRYKTLFELSEWDPSVEVDVEMLGVPAGAVRHDGYILMPDEVERFEQIKRFRLAGGMGFVPGDERLDEPANKPYRKHPKHAHTPLKFQRTCLGCGKQFQPNSNTHRWCSKDCRKKARDRRKENTWKEKSWKETGNTIIFIE